MDGSRTELALLAEAALASADAVAVLEPAGGDFAIVAANPRALELLGGPGERLGRLLPPRLAEGLASMCAATLADGRPRADEAGIGPRGRPRGWAERQVVRLAAGRVALTVRDVTARHLEDLRRRALAGHLSLVDEQAALLRVAEAVARDEPPDAVIALVTEEAAHLFRSDTSRVARFEPDAIVVAGSWGEGAPPPGARMPLEGERAMARVARTGRAARVDDYAALRRRDPVAARVVPADFGSGMAAPIRAGARLWGGIVVVRRLGGAPFAPREVARLERFADLVGLAVSGAEAARRLRALAATDPLTGLANHRAFQERLSQEVARARRHGEPLSLVLLDLDHFKRVNDSHGHQAGDAVLADLARRLAEVARAGDQVARVGGEEFAWLLPATEAPGAAALAERARRRVEARPFPAAGRLSASLGVAELAEGADGQALFRDADLALIWSKLDGRNRCTVHDPGLPGRLAARRAALRGDEEPQRPAALRALALLADSGPAAHPRHSERVADLAEALAARLGWPGERRELLREAALVHDVGQVWLPDEALRAADELDPADARLRAHPALGARIARRVLTPEQVAWIRGHHERWDGSGFPDGLRGEQIPEGARLLAVAEAWELLARPAPGRPARPPDEALARVEELAGSWFWPPAARALRALGAGVDGAG